MKNKLHVFLDSTVLVEDPYLDSDFGKLVLKLAELDKIELLIASLVIEEVGGKYKGLITKLFDDFKKSLHNLNRMLRYDLKVDLAGEDLIYRKHQNFYKGLAEAGKLSLIDYENDFLPELVHRSIYRIKPFSEKKQEFRDAIIWLSYKQYILSNQLKSCHFISSNFSDFYGPDKDSLHPDLQLELPELTVHKSLKAFIESQSENLKLATDQRWGKLPEVNSGQILQYFQNQDYNDLFVEAEQYIVRNEISKFIEYPKPLYWEGQWSGEAESINIKSQKFFHDISVLECQAIILLDISIWDETLGNDKLEFLKDVKGRFLMNFTLTRNLSGDLSLYNFDNIALTDILGLDY